MREGHRREYDPREDRERLSFRERSERALAEVGICRSVSFRDLAEAHFGGHPYTARRTVNRWIRQGLMREHTAKGPKGGSFQVLTLTGRGVREKPGGRPLSGVWTPNNGPGPGRSSAPS